MRRLSRPPETAGTPVEDGKTRRRFLRLCGACLSMASALVSGCASLFKPEDALQAAAPLACEPPHDGDEFDYIVVGSGAGGGPLAANLALAGFKVLLLEAGGDEEPYDYQVPAFHALASEDERFAWNFFVRHYADEARQKRDEKFRPEENGVLYPRCATLGGCTAHNALILIYPHNSDWDHIAAITGDPSWGSANMRRYFERLERCEYVSPSETESRHGFKGWLPTNVADPTLVLRDRSLTKLVEAAAQESLDTLGHPFSRGLARVQAKFDPNDWRLVEKSAEGICVIPLSTQHGRRAGTREFIRRVQDACPDRLVVRTHALATRVLLDEDNRATGVEYLSGESLYRADPRHRGDHPAQRQIASARREVILCAGAFNTPQLLMLSGIGPAQALQRHGIPVRVDLPGVGENLQDRYEVGVVSKIARDFSLMEGMKLRPPQPGEAPDPQFVEWLEGKGPYTTNGSVIALVKRSSADAPEPDLFIFGLLGRFEGYFPGYSQVLAQDRDFFTWAVLKAHTNNTAGRVTLRSSDPRDVPEINFHYFDEGTGGGRDLAAVVEGLETARQITGRCGDLITAEILPGAKVQTPEQLRGFVKDNAWGHHASCTCKMGPSSDPLAVVDSRFRVHGTHSLRVVDASVFPKIPGFFIVAAVYMVSEKARDVIIEDATASAPGASGSRPQQARA
jgi:choline dehydrogenase-like flavoprotein